MDDVLREMARVNVGLPSDSEFFLLLFFFNLCEGGEPGDTGVSWTGEETSPSGVAALIESVEEEEARVIDGESASVPSDEVCLSIRGRLF